VTAARAKCALDPPIWLRSGAADKAVSLAQNVMIGEAMTPLMPMSNPI
jgi:hypothetical protein